MAQELVGSLQSRASDGGAAQISVVLLELGLEPAEQGKCVGGRARESRDNFVVIQPPDLLAECLITDSPW